MDGQEEPRNRPGAAGADQEQAGLSSTEARLWKVLRGHPGRVFSRAELVEQVMSGSIVLERTIDVHIMSLRKKLGPVGQRIETVRKRGYRFAAESPMPEDAAG